MRTVSLTKDLTAPAATVQLRAAEMYRRNRRILCRAGRPDLAETVRVGRFVTLLRLGDELAAAGRI